MLSCAFPDFFYFWSKHGASPVLINRIFQFFLVLGLLLYLVLGASKAHASTKLDHAAITVQLAGTHPPITNSDVALPYHWDRVHGAVDGQAQFSFTFTSDSPQTPQALYIPRIGNTFELILNGVIIGKMGDSSNKYEDFAKQPRYFPIPQSVLQAQNILEIKIAAQGGRAGGLSPILFGNVDELLDLYTSSYRWRVTGALVIAVVSSVLGGLTLLIWLRQRNLPYLFYAMSELLWSVYMADTLMEHSPLPWPYWGVVYYLSFGISSILIFKFALQIMDLHHGNLKRLCDWNLFATVPLTLIGVLGGIPWMGQIWSILTLSILSYVGLTLVFYGLRSKELEKRILAWAIIFIAIAGVRDFFVISLPNLENISAIKSNFGIIVWQRYAWLVFGFSLAWIIAERMRASTQENANTNQTLVRSLALREAELNLAFAEKANIERHQSMMDERQRLTRDMHDGLGSQLLGALHLSLDPLATREALTIQLRDTLDHLKLTVDAMQDTEGDIASLLGSLRYRLGPRLTAAGITLNWEVDFLPAVAGWGLQQSRDLQMILFEAFSNLIVHADATNATLHAYYDTSLQCIDIRLQDNGNGFDRATSSEKRGHGLVNIKRRAIRINAKIDISTSASGTKLALIIPTGAVV